MSRRRAIKKDKADDAAFRHGRDRHLGVSVSNEFYQRAPMFLSREGMNMELIGMYRGASAFLICNGPSFASLDHNLLNLPGVVTYGLNNGPASFRPNLWSCVDTPARFLKSIWLDPKITKFVPMAHFEKKIFDNEKWKMQDLKVGDCPNVIGFRRNEKFVADRFLFEDCMNWGNHKDYGGSRTVLLPALHILFLLGFRKVYLLGCDLTMSSDYAYHFDEQRDKGAVSCNNSTYRKMINEYFPQLKPFFDAENFDIYNCNADSALTVFPHVKYEDAIAEAVSNVGDVDNQRTWGMYSKPEDKHKFAEEPPESAKQHLDAINQLKTQKGESVTISLTQETPEIRIEPTIPMDLSTPQFTEAELNDPKRALLTNIKQVETPRAVQPPPPTEEDLRHPLARAELAPNPELVVKTELVDRRAEMEEQRRKLLAERQNHLAQKKAEIEQAQREVERQITEQAHTIVPENPVPQVIPENPVPQVIPVNQKRVRIQPNQTTSQQG